MNLADLYKKQISLSEWFDDIEHTDTEIFRQEDNWKRKRMGELSEIISFPFDKPTSFEVIDIVNSSIDFDTFLDKRGHEVCALRLIPKQEGLPKLRMRGMSINDVVSQWLPEQGIDPVRYQADFVPHPSDHIWSTIFVVNEHGVIGEMVAGGHNELTQGFHSTVKPVRFCYNFENKTLETYPVNDSAERHVEEIIYFLLVKDKEKQKKIKNKFSSYFVNDYLCGYFETVKSTDHGTWFIDWNRVLGRLHKDFWLPIKTMARDGGLTGIVGSPGQSTGIARIIHPDNISSALFNEGDILICLMTSPDYIPLMKRAGAVVTEEGGILSHAAIVSREMKLPCIVGAKSVLKELKNGDMVEVDAYKGIVRKIKN
ncbi:MAG: hypothetical protein COX81_01290 [Candidatus Magasanikbacteria bacterium CG_4_10_14_0_2_um_filter_37_12]|uniref:PEP-utilising enzyme mobile domain-containing protein n=1 Tax=Candidatus Magasanikbacteria bacterium CG_4_10_14_0_2_um_filter_37_12 TaxID=1974637 RepID=A0A2M7V937_9BACT|nr:MAG: hypothetical protein COX81_01290 [Candidatus Magasanikbacteria bacterium CG_4_10_14_0_2_um_filter_37_12]